MKKLIEVDWDSLPDVGKLLNVAKSRYFELNRGLTGAPSRKERHQKTFDACATIFNADLTHLYEGSFDLTPKYYVYTHLNTSALIAPGVSAITTFAATLGMTHFPFYIGKGTGDRCNNLNRSESHRKIVQKLRKMDREPKAVILKDRLTELEALMMESKLIDIFGLIPYGGYLTNLDEGLNSRERHLCYPKAFAALRKINQIVV